jgi:hypothetical protein
VGLGEEKGTGWDFLLKGNCGFAFTFSLRTVWMQYDVMRCDHKEKKRRKLAFCNLCFLLFTFVFYSGTWLSSAQSCNSGQDHPQTHKPTNTSPYSYTGMCEWYLQAAAFERYVGIFIQPSPSSHIFVVHHRLNPTINPTPSSPSFSTPAFTNRLAVFSTMEVSTPLTSSENWTVFIHSLASSFE